MATGQQQSLEKMGWNGRLPPELWREMILVHLPFKALIRTVVVVCKQWHEWGWQLIRVFNAVFTVPWAVVDRLGCLTHCREISLQSQIPAQCDPMRWTRLCELRLTLRPEFHGDSLVEFQPTLLTGLTALRALSYVEIPLCMGVVFDPKALCPFTPLTQLESLRFNVAAAIEPLLALTRLTRLDFMYASVNLRPAFYIAYPNLRSLTICIGHEDHAEHWSLASKLTCLSSLDLSTRTPVSFDWVSPLVSLSLLTDLSLSYNPRTESVTTLSQLTSLRVQALYVDEYMLRREMPNLRKLHATNLGFM